LVALFSDFETALVVKFEPKIFPTEKAFQFKQNFHKKSENPSSQKSPQRFNEAQIKTVSVHLKWMKQQSQDFA
jgi:hypothetical protein